ncbi:restriction endonuclease subunit S [bacterium]|nr:restriction endonuclease subunit S [bacterium]MBU1598899.1 restriction endonuclease subunit S [bacterium]
MKISELEKVRLAKICSFIRGVTFEKSMAKNQPFDNSIPVLRAGNIKDNLDFKNDLLFIPNFIVLKEQILQKGDIVICISSGSPNLVGKSASLESSFYGTVGAFCGIVRPLNENIGKFLKYWFRSNAFWNFRDSITSGVNIQNLQFSKCKNLTIKIPKQEAETISIAAELERKMAEIQKMRQAADRELEAISALPGAILREVFPWKEGDRLPEGWRWVEFPKCILNKSIGVCKIPEKKYLKEGTYPIVDQGAKIIAGYTNDKSSVYEHEFPVINFGDHTRIFKYIDFNFAIGADGTKIIHPNLNIINPKYFYFVLRSSDFPDDGYNRHYKYLKFIQIPIPPTLIDQTRIATELERKMAEIQTMRQAVDRELEAISALPGAILREVFDFEEGEV